MTLCFDRGKHAVAGCVDDMPTRPYIEPIKANPLNEGVSFLIKFDNGLDILPCPNAKVYWTSNRGDADDLPVQIVCRLFST